MDTRSATAEPGLIERFMPRADVSECHETLVRAPADLVFEVARGFDFQTIPIVRALFWARARVMGARSTRTMGARPFVDEAMAIGWGMLAERPRREIVMGAFVKPWEADVAFTAVAPDEFASFDRPGGVKIAWTLESIPVDDARARFRTQTRVLATDDASRARFLAYWRWARNGIVLIRLLVVPSVRREAERRYGLRVR